LAVHSMIQTLAHLNHHVCTTFGDSETVQGFNNWEESVVGIRQRRTTDMGCSKYTTLQHYVARRLHCAIHLHTIASTQGPGWVIICR